MWAKGRGRELSSRVGGEGQPRAFSVSLSFLGEETVLNSGREGGVECGWLSSELAGLSWSACAFLLRSSGSR